MDLHGKPLEIIGKGATATIYRDGDRAIKRYENASLASVEQEAALQSFAHAAGLPVPEVWGVRKADGQVVLLEMAYIPGEPIMNPNMDQTKMPQALHTLVKLQRKVHAVSAEGLPRQSERLTWRIQRNPELSETVKDRLLARLRGLGDGSACLCHGDYHPLNVIDDGRQLWIIDWVNATSGSPLADACRSYLMLTQYMAQLGEMYLRLFCEVSGADPKRVLDWLPIMAADRMLETEEPTARDHLKTLATECPPAKA